MLSAAISGGLMGMAFSKAVAAGANTREGKVMTVAGLAGLGVFGCVSLIFTWDFSTRGPRNSRDFVAAGVALQIVGSGHGRADCVLQVRQGIACRSWILMNDQRVARTHPAQS